ncbi:type II toxin-antitoxin system VapC family toxin [Nonomuraea spiralis]|uniref:type II toxin-antitoxin system VapC family toxin n=1 Tax=Nonomuraea spiralis TaxID=46182 RepID=UPI003789E040
MESRVGPQAEVTFLKSFGGNGFHVAELEDEDLPRMAELVERYVDLPLGLVDAAVIAIAERLGLKEVATVDHRHWFGRATSRLSLCFPADHRRGRTG